MGRRQMAERVRFARLVKSNMAFRAKGLDR